MAFQVLCVAFSPDNDHFVSGSSDGCVKVDKTLTFTNGKNYILIELFLKGLGGGHQAVSPHIHRPFRPSNTRQ